MSYGVQYALTAPATSQTASIDLFEILAPTTGIVLVTSFYIGQSGTADFGDAQSEGIKVQIIKGHTVSGSGGAASTAIPLQTGFPVYTATGSATAECHNTTIASSGTPLTLHEDNWNVQIGYQWRPAPNEYIVLAPGERLVVRLGAPATDAMVIQGTINFTRVG